MPGMNSKKSVQNWLSRITRAEERRKKREEEWRKNYIAIFGADWTLDQKSATDKRSIDTALNSIMRKGKYPFDLLLSFLKTELPNLVLTRPDVYITATSSGEDEDPQATQDARTLQTRVNALLNDMEGLDIDYRCMLIDAHAAYAIKKTLPIYRTRPHPKAGQPVTNGDGQALFDPTTGQPLIWPDEELSSPEYDICRVSPFKFLIDEHCENNPKRAIWLGEEVDSTLEHVKTSGLYEPEIVNRLESKIREKQGEDLEDWEINLTLYELYNQVEDKIIVICKEYDDDFLRYDDTPDGIEKHPYTFLRLTEIPGQWFPKPEISSGRVQQEEYREGREWQRKAAAKSNPQIGVKQSLKEALPNEVAKIGDGKSDSVIVNNEGDVFPLNKENGKSEVIEQHMSVSMRDFDQVMGQPAMSRGIVGDSKFATEAEIAAAKGDLRHQDKNNMVKQFFSKGIEKLIFLMAVNDSENPDLREAIRRLKPDLNVQIDIENKNPRMKAIEQKQMTDAISAVPALAQSQTFMKELLDGFNIRDIKKVLQEVQQAQQAEAQANAPQPKEKDTLKGSISISFNGELLPKELEAEILGMLLNKELDTQDVTGQPEPAVPLGGGSPDTGESVGAGTEGMGPGNGGMPGAV